MCSLKKSKSSTSDNQEPEESRLRRRKDTSPPSVGSQLPVTSSIGITSSPTGILYPIIGTGGVNPHTRAAVCILGTTAAAAGTAYIDEIRPPGTAKGSTEFYGMCTESLGFESMWETMDLCKAIEERSSSRLIPSRKTKMCGVTSDKWRLKVFPPILSSLDGNGRPRFSLEKVRSDGRLNIVRVDNKADFVGGEGDVALQTVKIRRDDQEDDVDQTVEMTGDGQDDDDGKNRK